MQKVKLHNRIVNVIFSHSSYDSLDDCETIDVDDSGEVHLHGSFSPADLKKIASVVNKEMRKKSMENMYEGE